MTVSPLTPEELAERHLPLPGTHNVRDVGGYAAGGATVRWRTLLRSDALHQLDDKGRAAFAEIGLRTVIDLREHDELATSPSQLEGLEVTVLHRPLFDRPATGIASTAQAPRTLEETYLLLVDERGDALVGAVRELAVEGALPALVHCTAGKDRTGMVIALVLAAVGVDDDEIAADFALTGELLSGAFREEILARSAARGVPPEAIEPMLSADPALIRAFLARVREHGGDVVGFLFNHGLEPDELERLRAGLIDEPADPHTAEGADVA